MKQIILLVALVVASPGQAAIIADHSAPSNFDMITANDFQLLRESYNIYYGRTSHGSQIVTGLEMLSSENFSLYLPPTFTVYTDDLGHNGDLAWERETRHYLTGHPEINMVMWSWCSGCSDNTEEGISIYLDAMNQLELDYPGIVFIYMTGHLDGTGVDGVLYRSNNQIREYCIANNKVLFDFADIESWDPAGIYYPDETDACGWCLDWCAENTCPEYVACAHSDCFNCYQKGKSFWWMLHQISDLNPVAGINTPGLFFELSQNYPNPFNPSTEIKMNVKRPGTGMLAVYDLAGNKVSTLYEGYFETGVTEFSWNATGNSGQRLSSGIYFCRLQIGTEVQEIKMAILK
jgi:FlgD Ig-like domain